MTLADCGVADHDAACLCDVKVTSPTPVRYDIHETYPANRIAEASRFDREAADDAATYAFMERALDIFVQMEDYREQCQSWPEQYTAPEAYDMVADLVRGGMSILDVPETLTERTGSEWTWSAVKKAATAGQPSPVWTWSELRWLDYEAALEEQHDVSRYALYRDRFDVRADTVGKTLERLYGRSPKYAMRRGLTQAIIDNIHLPYQELRDELAQQGFDTAPLPTQYRRVLNRIKKGTLNVSVMPPELDAAKVLRAWRRQGGASK